ncbi:Gfo/Idh/MocA family oxidoreductase [Paenibacillus sp. KQZ6P-2]|uniref:Gfo/Idh/MocA family oxidoreductase n=1 Tax=Paenibacillus mangrovi TaxID=2931978 RepID=A0A9X1WTI0_9BACL|nr:Gfo/Idh/MocA family oxidoreductase [Paenibacillus mangrovi]MCJ8014723.1 Gfo/Idh/MocA family oxidoreductase [Paenibacillus mangrovi]
MTEQKHRIIVAGCGAMSHIWIQTVLKREDTDIVALVDVYPENARKIKNEYSLQCEIYTELEPAIMDTNASLVIDVTIPDSHFDISTTAMRNGCNVFGEKPMAANLEQAKEIIQVSEVTGKTLSVMQNRRYDANIRALMEMIQSGIIGKPGMVNADFFLGPHFGGFRDMMDSPLILDMAIHTFDQARFILRADPVSVYCHEFNPPGSWYHGNAAAICIYEMSDGSVFCYRGSWCAEGASTSWESDWRITGEKGTAIWDGVGAPYAEIVGPKENAGEFQREIVRIETPLTWTGQLGHPGCIDEMFLALAQGRPAETDCRDNIHSMEMVMGAIDSARSGKKVFF